MAKRKPKRANSIPESWAPWFFVRSAAMKRRVRLQGDRWGKWMGKRLDEMDAALDGARAGESNGKA